jgi:hypothetical protein
MTGFDSKRQAAMDKLVEIQEELGMYDDQKPEPKPQGDPLYEPLRVEKQDD